MGQKIELEKYKVHTFWKIKYLDFKSSKLSDLGFLMHRLN